jgi:predicted transcriptional regulator
MTKKIFVKPEDVERVLDGGKRLTMRQLMSRLGVSHPGALYRALPDMLSSGRVSRAIERIGDDDMAGKAYVYFTSEPARVAPPYRDMRLTETLSGYDKELNRFAELCASTRKAA